MSSASAPIRLGAVDYLNARPLTWALDREPRRWQVRYDRPSVCAGLLAASEIDLGLVPSVEYLQSPDYRFVPGIGIGSRGPVASVALYTRRPIGAIHRVALDTSARTSVALIKVLAHHRFGINPEYVPHPPDLEAMVRIADAGLLIGDPALEMDHAALGLEKIDLGEEWTAMTRLPFVYAAWTGRAGAVDAGDIGALQAAQADGVSSFDAIAEEYGKGDAGTTRRASVYLRDNIRYGLGPEEVAGLQLFLDHAAALGLGPARREVAFF